MTGKEAVAAVYSGNLVGCSKQEYHTEVREALHHFAGKCVDRDDGVRAQIALSEVKRLDAIHAPNVR